ncbi:MAG: N-6 DNA methylase [Gaiellales bacterium]
MRSRTWERASSRIPQTARFEPRSETASSTRTTTTASLLRLVYRLLFLFVAEDRELLLSPDASADARERYERWYSTRRLRQLAERRRGTKHADLYEALKLVMTKLGQDGGCPELGLPSLGSFLWSEQAIAHLAKAELANADLLEAVRALATVREGRVLRSVDYRNLGAEELGSVYESLLELHPELNADAGTFALSTAAGNERKTTGSYYTPSSLISCLLDSALDPVLEEAAAKGEEAVLDLKVCDPACGSGHFLVAAAHRIAKRLAALRTGDEEPSPEATRHALRDVVSRCLYGVDVNPMAVELCKVSLWMEALDPGRPLSFLDAHVKCGNSLLGTTAELMAQGIPDDAFKGLEGDDKEIAKALRKQNKLEREGQLSFEDETIDLLAGLEDRVAILDAAGDATPEELHAKEQLFRDLVRSEVYERAKLAADAWCAAFVQRKQKDAPRITTGVVRRFASGNGAVPNNVAAAVRRLAAEYAFFHWEVEYPGVFGRAEGGFDVVLGNPPWERVKLQEKEFFADHTEIAGRGTLLHGSG